MKGEDRISKLPDEILQYILSKIHLKEAVQTSILSKRWKHVWCSLLDLDFDFTRLSSLTGLDLDWSFHNQRMPHFTNFVMQFLSHRDDSTTVGKFRLLSSKKRDTNPKFIEQCLDYAINHGAQHIELDAYCSPVPVRFPDGPLPGKTLRVLCLRQRNRSVSIPKPFVLPNLKTLCLDSFKFKDEDVEDDQCFPIEPFSSFFPELEKLALHNCDISGLIIAASKLRNLEISFQGQIFSHEKVIEEISTPKLVSFRYEGCVSLVCRKVDLPSLEEVYFDISPKFDIDTDHIKKRIALNSVRTLQQLGNAKLITLTFDTIEVLAMDLHLLEQSPSPFSYIKCLKLTKAPHIIHQIKTVPMVMNYLTKGALYVDSLVME